MTRESPATTEECPSNRSLDKENGSRDFRSCEVTDAQERTFLLGSDLGSLEGELDSASGSIASLVETLNRHAAPRPASLHLW